MRRSGLDRTLAAMTKPRLHPSDSRAPETYRTVRAHPVAWQIAYHAIDGAKAGPGKLRVAIRILDAIAAAVHPSAKWPNPWAAESATEQQRVATVEACGRDFDFDERAEVDLSAEQAEHLLSRLREWTDGEATVQHGRVVVHLIEALEGASGEA